MSRGATVRRPPTAGSRGRVVAAGTGVLVTLPEQVRIAVRGHERARVDRAAERLRRRHLTDERLGAVIDVRSCGLGCHGTTDALEARRLAARRVVEDERATAAQHRRRPGERGVGRRPFGKRRQRVGQLAPRREVGRRRDRDVLATGVGRERVVRRPVPQDERIGEVDGEDRIGVGRRDGGICIGQWWPRVDDPGVGGRARVGRGATVGARIRGPVRSAARGCEAAHHTEGEPRDRSFGLDHRYVTVTSS